MQSPVVLVSDSTGAVAHGNDVDWLVIPVGVKS
jgi:hypothetical protein